MKHNSEELFPLVNEQGEVIGKATRAECHNGSKPLHPVVHLLVFNTAGELLLQKRSMNKDIEFGKWDTSVGGHVDYGENIEAALLREAQEELGISNFSPEYLQTYIFESDIEKELVNTFTTVYDSAFNFAPDEIDEIRFWSRHEIENNIGKGVFTPNFEKEWQLSVGFQH